VCRQRTRAGVSGGIAPLKFFVGSKKGRFSDKLTAQIFESSKITIYLKYY